MAAVPKLYNQMRLESFEWVSDPASSTPSGLFTANFVAWTTDGLFRWSGSDVHLVPDDDPTATVASLQGDAVTAIVAAGYTLADDPTAYNP
jgi:hypothetical protein